MSDFTRSFPLLDISVRSGGDGRTVEAYAAVWDTPTPISDFEGQYEEQISRTSFDRTLAHRGDKPWPVIFNHGMTLHGTPSPLDSMPIGATVERPRSDGQGLLTVSRYHSGERADQALEAIKSGAISAQSFSGRFIASDQKKPRGGYRAAADGSLTRVTRTEIAMREFGPAVFAAYPSAAITGVRAQFADLSDEQLTTLLALATPLDPAERTDTSGDLEIVADESALGGHSSRQSSPAQRRAHILAAIHSRSTHA